MTAAQKLAEFNNWNISEADVSLWGFRKRNPGGQVSYTAKWINTDNSLSISLGAVFATYQGGYRDTIPYDILAQPLETQFLSIDATDTHASILLRNLEVRRESHAVTNIKELENITGYIFRIQSGHHTAYAIKKTDSSFKTKKAASFINAVFSDEELQLVSDRSFRLENKFDFIIFDDTIFIHNKKAFESLLDFRQDFARSFNELVAEPEFSQIFDSTTAIENFVGNNMVHLRRMSAIKQKGHYKDQRFMANVQTVNQARNWGLIFDANGKIVPTEDTAKIIITILLDHRLLSELTSAIYDVSSTIAV